MLVLSRKIGERIVAYDPENPDLVIEFVLVRIRGQAARIGIEAPSGICVKRAEISDIRLSKATSEPATKKVTKKRTSSSE